MPVSIAISVTKDNYNIIYALLRLPQFEMILCQQEMHKEHGFRRCFKISNPIGQPIGPGKDFRFFVKL